MSVKDAQAIVASLETKRIKYIAHGRWRARHPLFVGDANVRFRG